MALPYELRIGLRYTRAGRRARRRNAFISFISAVSMAGIALGVGALIIVLSVMNGFTKEVRDRMLSVLAHVEISSFGSPLLDWRGLAQKARAHPEVVAAAPFVSGQALLTQGEQVRGVAVRGILPAEEPKVAEAVTRLAEGSLSELAEGEFNIVLGRELANALGVSVGDRVSLIAPHGTITSAGVVPRLRQFRIVGTFDSGHFEFDSTLVLVHLSDAERLFDVAAPTGVRLRLQDMQRAPRVAAQLAGLIEPGLLVRDWSRQNRTWFAAVQDQKRLMAIILTLIVAVAAFNLVSTLVMTVTEKQSDIAILRTLGASPTSIMAVFIVQGALIGVIGTALGVAGGLLVATNIDVIVPAIEGLFGVRFLDPSIYFIHGLPSDPRAADVVPISLVSLVLALVATLYPSWRASRLRPAEALRYD
ncbi:MAG TPA: lipoprotein-releasing ABC transporter permease subunit [Burkholderiaceae bacterium]|nr:lipoprotein-releasing ABC transporter permease subunit [Burkholderiaceae bacterium]